MSSRVTFSDSVQVHSTYSAEVGWTDNWAQLHKLCNSNLDWTDAGV